MDRSSFGSCSDGNLGSGEHCACTGSEYGISHTLYHNAAFVGHLNRINLQGAVVYRHDTDNVKVLTYGRIDTELVVESYGSAILLGHVIFSLFTLGDCHTCEFHICDHHVGGKLLNSDLLHLHSGCGCGSSEIGGRRELCGASEEGIFAGESGGDHIAFGVCLAYVAVDKERPGGILHEEALAILVNHSHGACELVGHVGVLAVKESLDVGNLGGFHFGSLCSECTLTGELEVLHFPCTCTFCSAGIMETDLDSLAQICIQVNVA